MVFFTCNACGESLKKAQVEKHLSFCRNSQCLSCIDCGKDFWGNEYKTHLKCITEDEKYGGKGFEAKGFKGDAKQQQWLQRIQEAMKKPNLSNNLRDILNQVSTYDNIPRKKAKFQNFIRNSFKVNDPALQDQVWEILETSCNEKDNTNNIAPSNTPEPESKAESSAATEETEKKKSKRERKEERKKKNKKEKKDLSSEEQLQNGTKKKGKKRKMEEDEIPETGDEEAKGKKRKKHEDDDEAFEDGEEEASGAQKKGNDSEGEEQEEQADENGADENVDEESGKKGKFNWKGTIKALLRQAPDNELPIKKLRKKVIAQYYVISSEQHKSEEELLATFNKKIHKNPTFRVLKERVKLEFYVFSTTRAVFPNQGASSCCKTTTPSMPGQPSYMAVL